MKAKFSNPKMMSTKDLELPLATDVGHKVLITLVKKLFKGYRGEREYITGTVIGLLKGDK